MPAIDGIHILNTMVQRNINIPVIVCSSFITQYEKEINREKVLKALDKISLPSISSGNISNIFLDINTMKSCMVLSGELKNYVSAKKKRAHVFCDTLNELKKSLLEG
jgi:chemotaxis response regulator CheB